MSQWLTILFGLLLNQFWFKSCDLGFVRKLWCYTLFPESFRFFCYVISSHQFDLSKSCKHWDIFLSHCMHGTNFEAMGFLNFPVETYERRMWGRNGPVMMKMKIWMTVQTKAITIRAPRSGQVQFFGLFGLEPKLDWFFFFFGWTGTGTSINRSIPQFQLELDWLWPVQDRTLVLLVHDWSWPVI